MSRPICVAAVSRSEIVAYGICAMLSSASSRIAAVRHSPDVQLDDGVDVAVYDIDDTGGMRAITAFLVGSPQAERVRVLAYSWDKDPELARMSALFDAHALVSKTCTSRALVAAVEKAAQADLPRRRRVGPLRRPSDAAPDDPVESLSRSEVAVLALICRGASNDEICQTLFITMNTLKGYIRSLYSKIDVDTRSQAMLWGVDNGFRLGRPPTCPHEPAPR